MSLFKRFSRSDNPGGVDEELVPAPPPRVAEPARMAAAPPHEELHIELAPDYSLDDLLMRLVEEKGSDLHLSVGSPPAFRVHGSLHFTQSAPLEEEKAEHILYPVINPEDLEHYFVSGNHDFAYEIPGVARFRGNLFRQNQGIAAVFRIIPSQIMDIDSLNLPNVVKRIALIQSGLVVVTGPTGSGKSTTLAAMINLINHRRQAHIITIEDPIEFVHECQRCIIDHREVGHHALSFADGLRAALREDPDIILVGEMRDQETIYNAVKAAETGALVFGTLHTNNAGKTIERIIDVFPARQQNQIRAMLSESLRAVIAQLLLRRIDGRGRVAVNEILIADSGFSNIIREGKTSQVANYISMGTKAGMQTMDMALLEALKRKQIHPGTAAEFCSDPTFFKPHGYNFEN